ncbi:MAG: alanine racemase [Leucobacter sp.]
MIPAPELSLTKGLGPAFTHADPYNTLIGASLFDMNRDFPQLSISSSAIEQNIAAMASYVTSRGVRIAPHGKTAMSPALAHKQIAAGAWGITAATPTQLRVYRHFGISRLFLANQLVEPGAIAWLRDELSRDNEFQCFVTIDSLAGLKLLGSAEFTDGSGHPIDVMLEVGNPGGRTGSRTIGQLRELAQAAATTPGVRVAGITNYEGTLGGASPAISADRVYEFAATLAETVAVLESEALLPEQCWVSIGGSGYFDEALNGLLDGGVTANRVVLRSGAYLTHDDGLYSRISPAARGVADVPVFTPAITVWAPILSFPEPGLAILLCGRRDVGFDQGFPTIRGVRHRDGSNPRPFIGQVTDLADQHAFVTFDPGQFDAEGLPTVGSLIELGISHPCTTLDRWGLVPVLDDQHRVRELIRMYFK